MTQAATRHRVSRRRLYGPSYACLDALRRRIKKTTGDDGRSYVYRSSRFEILIANHEIPDQPGLVGVYDRRVSNVMLREDLYGDSATEGVETI